MKEVDVVNAPTGEQHHVLTDIIRRRRSVRQFERGRKVSRDTLLSVAESARWAPTGANAQHRDLLIVDDPTVRDAVIDIFVEQSNRLFVKAKGFPAVSKAYLSNTVAIFIVVGDPRWKAAFPQQIGRAHV